jgi:LacI family transcriptional regulator
VVAVPVQPKSSRRKLPSMHDVARLAGVSQTTVSFVVNNVESENIPQETRDRVWAAVNELGYRPNAMARSLVSQRSQTIGVLLDEIATTPHAGKIIQGAQDAAWASNKILIVVNSGRRVEIEAAAVEMLLERQVEGIIYATMYHRPIALPVALRQVPTVLLDCYVEDRSLPSVVPDEVQGGRTATQALLRKGHRRIGFVNNVDSIPAAFGRLKGYKQALASYGVPFDPSLVCTGGSSAAEGYRCALELMRLPEPPTALFCFSDLMAMGAYDTLRKLGRSIPHDVAVVGFDNQELIAGHLYPPLSTLELPHYQMGQWAVQYLVEHAEQVPPEAPIQHTLLCSYIERQST